LKGRAKLNHRYAMNAGFRQTLSKLGLVPRITISIE
jgi:hypothetical protein